MNGPHLFAMMNDDQSRIKVKHFDADANERVVVEVALVDGHPLVTVYPDAVIQTSPSREHWEDK